MNDIDEVKPISSEVLIESVVPMVPITHSLLPGVNMRAMKEVDAHEKMIKLRAQLGQLDCQIHNLLRRLKDDPTLAAKKSTLERERLSIFTCMQLLEQATGISILFSPFTCQTPEPSIKIAPSVAGQSESVVPSAVAESNQSSNSAKRSLEIASNEDSGEFKLIEKKKSKLDKVKKGDSKAAEVNNPENMDVDPNKKVNVGGVRKNRIPPFFIIPPPAWHVLLSQIRNFVPTFRSQTKGKFLKIEVDTENEYRTIQAFFRQNQVQFKAFLLDEDKPAKFVLRGLPLNTEINLIKTALEIEGFSEVAVTQLYRGSVSNKKYMPLFLVNLAKKQENIDLDNIFQITELYGTAVSFEIYRGKKGPSQCFNCQGYFHAASACNLPARCVKCAGAHKTKDCVKSFNDPCKCIHCGGDHPANFRNCPRFPKTSKPNNKFNSKTNAKINKNQNNKNNKAAASNQAKPFTSNLVRPAQSYAGIASGHRVAPVVNTPIPNQSVPSKGADSATDFINLLLAFEKSYSPAVVLQALEKALPALRVAHSEVDRISILYRSILTCSGIQIG